MQLVITEQTLVQAFLLTDRVYGAMHYVQIWNLFASNVQFAKVQFTIAQGGIAQVFPLGIKSPLQVEQVLISLASLQVVQSGILVAQSVAKTHALVITTFSPLQTVHTCRSLQLILQVVHEGIIILQFSGTMQALFFNCQSPLQTTHLKRLSPIVSEQVIQLATKVPQAGALQVRVIAS